MADDNTLDLADAETYMREASDALLHGHAALAAHKLAHAQQAIAEVRAHLMLVVGPEDVPRD